MIEFRACWPEHIRLVQVQREQVDDFNYVIGGGFEQGLALRGWAYSAWLDTRCIAVGGVVPKWTHCAEAWAFVAPTAGPAMPALTRFGRRLYQAVPYRRISTYVRCDFVNGHRWAKALGFRLETERARMYDPAGHDCALYAYLKD